MVVKAIATCRGENCDVHLCPRVLTLYISALFDVKIEERIHLSYLPLHIKLRLLHLGVQLKVQCAVYGEPLKK